MVSGCCGIGYRILGGGSGSLIGCCWSFGDIFEWLDSLVEDQFGDNVFVIVDNVSGKVWSIVSGSSVECVDNVGEFGNVFRFVSNLFFYLVLICEKSVKSFEEFRRWGSVDEWMVIFISGCFFIVNFD